MQINVFLLTERKCSDKHMSIILTIWHMINISYRPAHSRLKYDRLINTRILYKHSWLFWKTVYVSQVLIMLVLINATVQKQYTYTNTRTLKRDWSGATLPRLWRHWRCRGYWLSFEASDPRRDSSVRWSEKLMNQANKPAASVLLHNVLWDGRTWWGASRSAGSDELPPACWWWII